MILDGTNGVTYNDSSLQGAAASPYVLKNRIINGAMVIDQRNAGASVTLPDGSAAYSFVVDRWLASRATVATATAQQSSDVPTGQGFVNSFVVTNGTASTSGSTDAGYIGQIIEGYNIADLGWGTASAKTVTLSFWVKSSITGTHSGSLFNSAATQFYPFSYSISVANTWEQKTITVAGSTSGTWLTTNGRGLFIAFNNGTGSSYLGTANAWTGSVKYGVTGSVALNSVTGSTWYLTGVQLEIGSSATPFERRLYNQELAACQRYYYKTTPLTGNQPAYSVVGSLSTTRSISMHPVPMPVTMRTSPTVGYNSVMITNAATSVISSTVSSVSTYNTATASNYVTLDIAYSAGGSSGNIYALSANANGSYLDFSAEL
jgi:hypothetical protein